MRELLLRGRVKENKDWIYWDHFGRIVDIKGLSSVYDYNGKKHYLISEMCELIDPGTVCQYTGKDDRSGRKIFEEDILRNKYSHKPSAKVVFYGLTFSYQWLDEAVKASRPNIERMVENTSIMDIIGNAYDSPELLVINE